MLDIIFPNLCVYCKNISTGEPLCKSCYSEISFIDPLNVCTCCGVPFSSDSELTGPVYHKCGKCIKEKINFTRCRSVAQFNGVIRELLHSFKYRKKLGIGKIFAKLLTDNFPKDLKGFDLLLPVPLYINKLREREYNQSAVLVSYLSNKLRFEKDLFSLIKSSETNPQIMYKTIRQRKKNILKSFTVRNVKKVKKRSILLVDDVYTSGSTLNECAKVLLESGAVKVQALTLLRAYV